MDRVTIIVCCVKDDTGREKQLGIMTEKSIMNCKRPYWHYTRKMMVPREKLEALHIGNVKNYLASFEV